MRIQHNIPALNSYRNYYNNVNKVSKNLEKLSTGYKINRAGDDAAGLAISEKMRIQITGLEQAQSNAKAGINLVQTAEGALTEVHDMLNRMYTLAEESANGTFDDSVDRKQLQKEVDSLRTEIDRIADATNYNGIQLLDGSLSKDGVSSKNGPTSVDLSGLQVDMYANAKTVSAIKGKFQTDDLFAKAPGVATAGSVKVAEGDTFSMTINYTDTDGREIEKTLDFTVGKAQDGTTVGGGLWLEDGTEGGTHIIDLGTAKTVASQDIVDAVRDAINKNPTLKDLKSAFDVTENGNGTKTDGLQFEARVGGEGGARLNSITMSWGDKDSTIHDTKATWEVGHTETTLAKDEMKAINMDKAIVLDLEADGTKTTVSKNIEDAIFEVNGEKFAFIKQGTEKDIDVQNALRDAGVTHWVEVATGTTIAAADVEKMVNKIATATGLKVEQGAASIQADGSTKWQADTPGAATGTEVLFTTRGQSSSQKDGAGLRLQIGDTAQSFNMLTVEINDMHTSAMKFTANADDDETIRAASGMSLADIDISNQNDASKAMAVIKNATNYVSDVRGGLGALQNRLDHTINNLSVAQENIQDAESNIRDVDVAKEMMAYTKNNILVQSAQAMLAQANQLPQGVLQLLGSTAAI